MVRYGIVHYGIVHYGIVHYGIVQYAMLWYGMVCYGVLWYAMVFPSPLLTYSPIMHCTVPLPHPAPGVLSLTLLAPRYVVTVA